MTRYNSENEVPFAWNTLVCSVGLTTIFTVPLSLGWDGFYEMFMTWNLFMDVVFIADFAVDLFTVILNDHGFIISDVSTFLQLRHYLTVTDVLSSIPFDFILSVSPCFSFFSCCGKSPRIKN